MDVIDSRVRKCEDVSTVIDKKMRTRTIKFEKFIVPLTDNNPFDEGEFVKVLRKSDFEKIGELIKMVKGEREELRKEIKDLKILLESQRNYISSFENSQNGLKNKEKRSILKDLIKL
ncbi:MAG: hypothetical protein QMD61_00105 [Methanobacterium sp.]|nr:hypothetical protein [Methanobacterium sp.]